MLLVFPIALPLLTAIILLLTRRSRRAQRGVAVAGAVVLFGAALVLFGTVWYGGIQVVYVGNWPAPYGITLVADLLSGIMAVITGLMGLIVVVYSLVSIDERRERTGYYALVHALLAGVSLAFLTGDMFNLFVSFEIILLSSFVLLTLGGEREQLEGAVIYVTINLLSSALFLAAVGVLYGLFGTLNMADLALRVGTMRESGLLPVLALLFLATFGIKAGIFPFFFWLPASYHTPPVAVTTLFSALLTKVGIYAMLRVFSLLFARETALSSLILTLAGLTMVVGVLGAVAQYDTRRLLSFHIVSQIGYLLMGVGLFTRLALTGVVFFLINVIIAKSALFLISGLLYRIGNTYDLKASGGLYRRSLALSVLFLLPAFSLAGIPPLAGFWGKLLLVWAGLQTQHYAVVAAALAVSVLTLFSMMKIWAEAFWKDAPQEHKMAPLSRHTLPAAAVVPVAVLAVLVVAFGAGAGPVGNLAAEAATQLMQPEGYIRAVLSVDVAMEPVMFR
jgi:multicomponent Na+:H+ antiporter subunit D